MLFGRPAAVAVLCFIADCFFFFFSFWHFAALYLRSAWADHSEPLACDWICVQLDNVGPKHGATPKTIFGEIDFYI